MSGVCLPPMRKSCFMVPALRKVKVTVPGLEIDFLERWNENSLPLTETLVVAAAWAVGAVRAEAIPAGVSAAMVTAATMSFFTMECSFGVFMRASRR
jgi:hypothetical protein